MSAGVPEIAPQLSTTAVAIIGLVAVFLAIRDYTRKCETKLSSKQKALPKNLESQLHNPPTTRDVIKIISEKQALDAEVSNVSIYLTGTNSGYLLLAASLFLGIIIPYFNSSVQTALNSIDMAGLIIFTPTVIISFLSLIWWDRDMRSRNKKEKRAHRYSKPKRAKRLK